MKVYVAHEFYSGEYCMYFERLNECGYSDYTYRIVETDVEE